MRASPILGLTDTDPEADRVLFDLYKKMTPQERAERMVALCRAARSLAEAETRSRHPGISEHELRMRVASRSLPRDLMIEAFHWDPLEHGY
jgi:hypothetical protein